MPEHATFAALGSAAPAGIRQKQQRPIPLPGSAFVCFQTNILLLKTYTCAATN